MNQTTIIHEFNTLDKVYHFTPDSPEGTVLEWRYSSRNKTIIYNVSFGYRQEDDVWCDEVELTTQKTF